MTTTFDPKKCDHGESFNGATEFTYCENCDPERCAKDQAEAPANYQRYLESLPKEPKE